MAKGEDFGAVSMDAAPQEYPYEFSGQKNDETRGNCGPCEGGALCGPEVSRLSIRRFATAHFLATNAAGVLTFAAQSAKLFTAGVGESGADAQVAGNLSDAETDAFSKGALVTKAGEHFRVRAVQVTIGSLFLGATAATARADAAWMGGYQAGAQRRLLEDVHMLIAHGEGEQTWKLGLLGMYPSMTGTPSSGDNFAQNGTPLAGAIIPLRSAFKAGSQVATERPQITLQLSRPIVLGARSDPATGDVVLPVRVDLLGYVRRGSADGPAVMTADNVVLQQMVNRQDRTDAVLAAIAQKLGL